MMFAVASGLHVTPRFTHATPVPLGRIVPIVVFPNQRLVGGRASRHLEFAWSGDDERRCPKSDALRANSGIAYVPIRASCSHPADKAAEREWSHPGLPVKRGVVVATRDRSVGKGC